MGMIKHEETYGSGLLASADLSAYESCYVGLDANGKIEANTDGVLGLGFLADDEADAAGKACRIYKPGAVIPIKFGGPVDAGKLCKPGTGGKPVIATDGSVCICKALGDIAADGDIGTGLVVEPFVVVTIATLNG